MKPEVKPLVAMLVEAGASLRRGLPVFELPNGFELVVGPETSKSGRPAGVWVADAYLRVRWPELERALGALGPRPDTGVYSGVSRLTSMVVGIPRWATWEIPSEDNLRDLASAILHEGRAWCLDMADQDRQVYELERNARSLFGQPVRWAIGALLRGGVDNGRVAAHEVLELLRERGVDDETDDGFKQVQTFLSHLGGDVPLETALDLAVPPQ